MNIDVDNCNDDEAIEYIKYDISWRASHHDLSVSISLLNKKFGFDKSKSYGGVANIIRSFIDYISGEDIAYYLLYSSDVVKIRYLLNKEFTYDYYVFWDRLWKNRTRNFYYMNDYTIRKVVNTLPNEVKNHPYIHVYLYPCVYIRAIDGSLNLRIKSKVFTKLSRKVLHMLPRPDISTTKNKLDLLRYNFSYLDRPHIDGKRHIINMRYLFDYFADFTIYLAHIGQKNITSFDPSSSLDKYLTFRVNSNSIIGEAYYMSHTIMECRNKRYLKYVINKIISDGEVEDVVDLLIPRISQHKIKILMNYNLLDNPIFRLLHAKLST
jgi:hypothetical protein